YFPPQQQTGYDLSPVPVLVRRCHTCPCNRWNRCLIVPKSHPILLQKKITLEALCQYPIITYVAGFTGRGHLNDTFGMAGLVPHIVLSATDTDVIKTYVREGMGSD
ncbi:MAG: hypothetical protein KZQ89_21880, partial [Candidatus Thiodiazotropha sp. (ex Lucinoma kastoroae)]|nr:hypothetical protein [Candidatus Thiodiazotropha sp. (ex Lucinoma kastoroae)]